MIVVMPMAGRGSRFKNEGYTTPKPFIQVAGMPMFLWGLKSLEPIKESIQKVILVVLKLDAEKNKLDAFLHQIPWSRQRNLRIGIRGLHVGHVRMVRVSR